MKTICSFFFLLSSLSLAFAQPDTLSLAEAIATGWDKNLNLALAKNSETIAANNVSLGNAGFLPTVGADADIGWTIENTQQSFINGNNQEIDGAVTRRINAGAGINWLVYDGGRMFVTLEKLKQLRLAENLNQKLVLENITADISDNYYLVVLEQERLRVLQNNLQLSSKRLDIARTKYEVGKASRLEMLAAQVDYNEDTVAMVNQQEALYTAKINLSNLLGSEDSPEFKVYPDIPVDLDLQKEELLNLMLENNLQLKLSDRQENIAQLELKEIRNEALPQINLNGGYEINRIRAEAGFLLSRRSAGFTYGATASVNIFDGFNRNRREQNARIQLENVEMSTDLLILDLKAQFNKLYASYSNGLILLSMEKENLEVARENTEIALERYNIGNANALELREAQQNLVDAESRLLNAAYTVKISETELLRISGRLIEGRE